MQSTETAPLCPARRPMAWARIAVLALAILTLGACDSLNNKLMDTVRGKIQLACPGHNIIADASRRLTYQPGPGRDLIDIDNEIVITGVETWAQCELCSQWRRLAAAPPENATWTCKQNPDAKYAKCSEPQELPDDEIDRRMEFLEKLRQTKGDAAVPTAEPAAAAAKSHDGRTTPPLPSAPLMAEAWIMGFRIQEILEPHILAYRPSLSRKVSHVLA